MATDAITVSSIFSNFNLPSKLKIYAEGESLLNDVTALVIFYFIALPMLRGSEVSFTDINLIVLEVVLKSTLIGISSGYLGFLSVKALKDPIEQFIIIYLVSIIAFIVAEHLHISGILSVITAVVSFKLFIDKELEKNPKLLFERYRKNLTASEDKIYDIIVNMQKYIPAMTKKEFRDYKKETFFIGIFANGVVFIIMAYIFDIQILLQYSFEIVVVFLLTTLIRFSSIFSMFRVLKKDMHWTLSLTLSGVKGALTIIMVHSLPADFIYRELFEAIVVGNVILTTFVYTLILVYYINKQKNSFKADVIQDSILYDTALQDDDRSEQHTMLNIKNYIEKDSLTGAYCKIFIEEILDKEIAKAVRYKLELSVIAFKIGELNLINSQETIDAILKDISQIVKRKIRTNDYYGKIEQDYYLIITSNTNLSGATILAKRLEDRFKEYDESLVFNFGITGVSEMESIETLFEKIEDALTLSEYSKKIEIEI
jgi:CPA1 family monovalent cation:H+ antiporter